MDIYFICLANSYKYGGRCIAGIEINVSADNHWSIIRRENGCPRWVRPIASDTEYGEIPEGEARFINLLYIIKLQNVNARSDKAHSEDVSYEKFQIVGRIAPQPSILNLLTDNIHPAIFYTTDYYITPEVYEQGDYSLMLVHPDGFIFRLDPSKKRTKYYLIFQYNGVNYDLSITDPTFYQYLEKHPKAVEELSDVYLSLSIGMEYEDRHHKLVAAIILPSVKQPQGDLFLIHQDILHYKSERRFTLAERLACQKAFVVDSQKGLSVCLKMWNGKERFILLEDGTDLKAWQKVSLGKALLVTYEDLQGNELERIRILSNKKSFVSWLKQLLKTT